MKILMIQCFEGTSKGEIRAEQIRNTDCFYYNFKGTIEFENDSDMKRDTVIFVIFNKEKEISGISRGIFNKVTDENNKAINNCIKINNIVNIHCDYINDIIESFKKIDIDLLNENNHSIKYVDINEDENKSFENIIEKSLKKVDKEKSKEAEVIESHKRFENNLSVLAQRSKYAKRVINKDTPRVNRTEYQRDWERIIHAKAFRRLEDKAQIYTLSKGDHFRTRLTHSMEVTQIARGLARELFLNEDLVEAIALGHDLGHTPFGHIGERTLNNILKTNKNIIRVGGFKHNYQSVKIVNYLEEKYGDFEGIDLTYQVMEGILKHTKLSGCKEDEKENCTDACMNCNKNDYKIKDFLCNGEVENLHPEYNFCTTLEGQVVAMADEIAQRAHDLDDGIASGIINIDRFITELEANKLFDEIKEKIDKSIGYIKDETREYIDVLDMKRARIVSDVITYFMGKAVEYSKCKMNEYIERKNIADSKDYDSEIIIDEKLVDFHPDIEKVRKEFEKITSNKVLNSEEVNCFDCKGEYIVNKLYDAYCKNPKQMPSTTLKRIYREISKYTNDVVYIRAGNKKMVDREIEIYKGKNLIGELERLKYRIFIRSVIDLISGMTDDFANKQFDKLYSPRRY